MIRATRSIFKPFSGAFQATSSRRWTSKISTWPTAIAKYSEKTGPVSLSEHKNGRSYMEDRNFVTADGNFLAVFDGHCGFEVSSVASSCIYPFYRKHLDPLTNGGKEVATAAIVKTALEGAMAELDEYIMKFHFSHQIGSTASMVVLVYEDASSDKPTHYVSCNLGDSRVVLSRGGKAIDLTVDHDPGTPEEMERIKKAGGRVEWDGMFDKKGKPLLSHGVYRLQGFLSIGRSFGDGHLRPYLSNVPDIVIHKADPEKDDFIIASTDGIYHVLSSQEAVSAVHDAMKGKESSSVSLINRAMKAQASDNLTVAVRWINTPTSAK